MYEETHCDIFSFAVTILWFLTKGSAGEISSNENVVTKKLLNFLTNKFQPYFISLNVAATFSFLDFLFVFCFCFFSRQRLSRLVSFGTLKIFVSAAKRKINHKKWSNRFICAGLIRQEIACYFLGPNCSRFEFEWKRGMWMWIFTHEQRLWVSLDKKYFLFTQKRRCLNCILRLSVSLEGDNRIFVLWSK